MFSVNQVTAVVWQEGGGAEGSGLWEDLSVPAAEEHHTESAGKRTQNVLCYFEGL